MIRKSLKSHLGNILTAFAIQQYYRNMALSCKVWFPDRSSFPPTDEHPEMMQPARKERKGKIFCLFQTLDSIYSVRGRLHSSGVIHQGCRFLLAHKHRAGLESFFFPPLKVLSCSR